MKKKKRNNEDDTLKHKAIIICFTFIILGIIP